MNEMPVLTQQRHRENLTKCVESLKRYLELSANLSKNDSALVAEELRVSSRWLSRTTGSITSDQILDVIFRDFCIGK